MSIGNIGNATEPISTSINKQTTSGLTSKFDSSLSWLHWRWYEYKIFIAPCTDNLHDLEVWLFGEVCDHVGIYGYGVAEGLLMFNVDLIQLLMSALEEVYGINAVIHKLLD